MPHSARLTPTRLGVLVLLVAPACSGPDDQSGLVSRTAFQNQMERACSNFKRLHQTDTVDLQSVADFPWDSVYVFTGYDCASHLAEGWPWVDWQPLEEMAGCVPEDRLRFVFVHEHKAVDYVDLSTRFIDEVHYSQYFKDANGDLQAYQGSRRPHFLPGNSFARTEAKFVLVRPARVPAGDSTTFVFTTATYCADKPTELRRSFLARALNMHPVKGCGYPNCSANKERE